MSASALHRHQCAGTASFPAGAAAVLPCISRESNPGHIDGDDVFCHQTTDALAADALCRWICLGRFARTWVRLHSQRPCGNVVRAACASVAVQWLVFPPATQKTRVQFPAAEFQRTLRGALLGRRAGQRDLVSGGCRPVAAPERARCDQLMNSVSCAKIPALTDVSAALCAKSEVICPPPARANSLSVVWVASRPKCGVAGRLAPMQNLPKASQGHV